MKRLILKSAFKSSVWKNGLGTTKEIQIYPPGADFKNDDFQWRVSMALVNSDNSFSQFKGFDRHLMVLSGDGFKLNSYTIKSFDIYSFKGEDPIFCSLISGPVEDLGVIYDRNLYRCSMVVHSLKSSQEIAFETGVHFVKVLSDGITIDNAPIDKENILKIEGPESINIVSDSSAKQIVVISIFKNLTSL